MKPKSSSAWYALVAALVWIVGCTAAPRSAESAGTYLIFFEGESAQLTPAAQEAIGTAAKRVRNRPSAMIRVTGYAAAAAPAPVTQALSEARAKAVADALIAQGVPRERLQVAAKGETKAVPARGVVDRGGDRTARIDHRCCFVRRLPPMDESPNAR